MTEPWKQWEGQDIVSINDQGFHFRLSQYLAGSEWGAVFLTEWGPEQQRAVIKLLSADPATADAQLARWRRIAALSHPHLLRLFHTGRCRVESTEMLFAVMEYAEEDLSQILPERALTASETLEMLTPTLDALAYLHAQGFVHGCLKPANIMAVHDQLKLASDGLYTAGEPVDAQRHNPYDPPEICDSTSRGIAPAADVWSLGITLTEILTQHRPAWKQTEQTDPVIPRSLPEPFLDIVHKCLRRDPQQRATVDQIASQLRPPAPALPKPGPAKQEVAKARAASRKWLFVVPAAAASLAAALFAGTGILHHQQPVQPQSPTQSGEDAPTAKPDKNPESQKTIKPSPITTGPSDAESRQAPQLIPASLPASSPEEDIKTMAKDSMNSSRNDGVAQQVLPDVPQKARDTIQGKIKVKVRVHVDAPGDVVAAELDSPGPSKYFAQLALQAAQRWKFTPAQAEGSNASRTWLLRFEFGSDQTKAFPSPVAQ